MNNNDIVLGPNPPLSEEEESEDDIPDFNFDKPAAPRRQRIVLDDGDGDAHTDLNKHVHLNTEANAGLAQHILELSTFLNRKKRAAAQAVMRGAATAYIDQDESGTYDPDKRATPPRRNRKRPRRVENDDEGHETRAQGNARARTKGYDSLLILKFESEKGLNFLRLLPAEPVGSDEGNDDNEDHASNDDDDDGYGGSYSTRTTKRRRKALRTLEREDGLTIDQLTIGHPQRRGCKACFESGIDECLLIDDGLEWPCEACEDAGINCELIVPPLLKRVCERCKKKRRSCSYKINHGKGVDSCKACEEDGVACIAGPAESSRRIDEIISRTTPERQLLLPARSPSPTPEPIRERMYVACNQCRNGGKRCNLKGKASLGPCSCCKKDGVACQFVFAPTRPRLEISSPKPKGGLKEKTRRLSAPKPGESDSHSKNTERLFEEMRAKLEKKTYKNKKGKPQSFPKLKRKFLSASQCFEEGNPAEYYASRPPWSSSIWRESPPPPKYQLMSETAGIRHEKIKTHFCHPIQFNYVPDPLGQTPCDWCHNLLFGLFGLSDGDPREVEGWYDPNGHGFEEIFGGFAELGHQPSKMCVNCTFTRLNIMQCEHHVPTRLTSNEVDTDQFNPHLLTKSIQAYITGDEAKGALIKSCKWCSICPRPAHYRCCAEPDLEGTGLEELAINGCGLMLCEECKDLMDRCNTDPKVWAGAAMLDTLVREVEGRKGMMGFGVRADAGFLTREGELNVRTDRIAEVKMEGLRSGEEGIENGQEKALMTPPATMDRKGKGKDMSFFR